MILWAPVAAVLAKDHFVIVPDRRGMGLSSHPEGGYDKKTQARDIAAVMDKLRIEKVTHDIGKSEIIVLIYVISYIIMLITFPAYATGSKNKNGLF